ncbi:MAG TPA: HD domain-containing protein [Candidatus Dormibacteraeota bacterium]|nr:HD domain-containing protein [Candidatus Dormibacteraeota bacterium]
MTPEELRQLVDGLAGLPYGGEAVDQRTHALQCAWHAQRAGADDDLVLAALLHDAGRAVRPDLDHERSGAELGRRLLGERAGWLIGSHAQAKRYLVAVEPAYAATLSPASIESLRAQGGPMTAAEAGRFAAHEWAADAVRLRRWDDLAKVPGGPEADLDGLLEVYRRRTSRT